MSQRRLMILVIGVLLTAVFVIWALFTWAIGLFLLMGAISIVGYKMLSLNESNESITLRKMGGSLALAVILLFSGIILDSYNMLNTSNRGSYYLGANGKEEKGEATLFFVQNAEQSSADGTWHPLSNPIHLPSTDYFYHERNDTKLSLTYTINLTTTLMFDNFTLYIYGDNDSIAQNHTLLRQFFYTGYTVMSRYVDTAPTTVYNKFVTIVMELFADEPHSFIHFAINLNMNMSYYQGLEVNFASHWIDINNVENDGVWGTTSEYDYSINWLARNSIAQMGMIAALFIGIFIMIFLIGFFTQNPRLVETFFFIITILGILTYLYYFVQLKSEGWYIDLMTGLRNWKNVLSFAWFDGFIAVIRVLCYLIQTFLWVGTIGISLMICWFMAKIIRTLTFGVKIFEG